MSLTITPLIVRPRDVALPRRAAYHAHGIVHDAALWLARELGGPTFTVGSPVSKRDSRTWVEIAEAWPPLVDAGVNIWKEAVQTFFKPTPTKVPAIFYLRPASPVEGIHGFGGMVGFEDWGWSRPGMTLQGDANAWRACGKTKAETDAMGWNPSIWWTETRAQVTGALCHEIVHMLVNSPHTSIPGDVMSTGYHAWPDVYVQEDVKAAILATGWLG